jgi:hypothetical protein
VSVLQGSTSTTTLTLASTVNPSNTGQTVTFKAVVRPPTGPYFGPPSGTVTFADAGTPLPGATIVLSGTSATFSLSTLSTGTHSITAAYSGDARFGPSTSPTLNQVVR